jgi:rhodanese-related sulfurtransferase
MHVHELNPRRTLITLIAFVILLIVGFLTMHRPELTYKLDMNQSVHMLNDTNGYFYPSQLEQIIGKKVNDVVLIDLRDNFTYGQGHIPGSENISAYDLTLKKNIKRLEGFKKQNITVVFYGNNQLQANGPWMLFRQLGFDNVKVLLGGYSYYKESIAVTSDTISRKNYILEVPRYDYAEIFSNVNTGGSQPKAEKSVINIVRKKKTSVASGGC